MTMKNRTAMMLSLRSSMVWERTGKAPQLLSPNLQRMRMKMNSLRAKVRRSKFLSRRLPQRSNKIQRVKKKRRKSSHPRRRLQKLLRRKKLKLLMTTRKRRRALKLMLKSKSDIIRQERRKRNVIVRGLRKSSARENWLPKRKKNKHRSWKRLRRNRKRC